MVKPVRKVAIVAALLVVVAMPQWRGNRATAAGPGGLTTGPLARYYATHPAETHGELRAALDAVHATAKRGVAAARRPAPYGDLFNRDGVGLPQNEESVSVCHNRPDVVVSGTNDYRGIVDPEGNFTGWYFSQNGGRSVQNEGLLPPVRGAGVNLPSGGDPSFVADARCNLYAGSLNYVFYGPGATDAHSGVGVYRTSPHTLASCPQGTDFDLTHPACWPTRRNLEIARAGHFLDKEWLQVGDTGDGEHVWVGYADLSRFRQEGDEAVEHAAEIHMVRCTADLSHCTRPIKISGNQQIAEYPDITIGPDRRTYVTWSEFLGGSFTGPAERGWMAVADAGSTRFSAPRLVQPRFTGILRGHPVGSLHANDFRLIGTLFTNTVTRIRGIPRAYVVWTECRAEVLGSICEEPQIRVRYSDDQGRTWSAPRSISAGGDNYFQSIDVDPSTSTVVVAYYTNRFDPVFHNRQDVELVTVDAAADVVHRQRVTKVSNETEADPLLRGRFIGDYLEVSADAGRAYVAYNANERHVALLGDGVPVPQQDNYLTRVPE